MYTFPIAAFWGWLCFAFTRQTSQTSEPAAAFVSLGVYAVMMVIAPANDGSISSLTVSGANILIATCGAIGAGAGASKNEQEDRESS